MKRQTFMKIAKIIASESTCSSVHVGAVIVKSDRILSTGYNGTPSGAKHCHEEGDGKWLSDGKMTNRPMHSEWSDIHEIHAEQNAICFAAKSGLSTDGAEMYVTISPCHQCSKLIVASGIKKVYINEVYDRAKDNWDSWLKAHGVEVYVLNEKERIC